MHGQRNIKLCVCVCVCVHACAHTHALNVFRCTKMFIGNSFKSCASRKNEAL